MLFVLSSLVVALYQRYVEHSVRMTFLRLLSRNMSHASVVFRTSKLSPVLCSDCDRSLSSGRARACLSPRQELVAPECSRQLWAGTTLEVLRLEPQLHIDLSDWTSYLGSAGRDTGGAVSVDQCHILLEVSPPDDPVSFLEQSMSIPPAKRVKVMDHAVPLAWKSGIPFSIVAACSTDALTYLGLGLKDGRLLLDDMLELNCITTVSIQGRPMSLLRPSSQVQDSARDTNSQDETPAESVEQMSSWSNVLDSVHSVYEDSAEVGRETLSDGDSNESLASLPLPEGCEGAEDEDTGLSAPHEQLLRLKDCTDYPGDSDTATEGSSVIGDTAAGEAPSGALEELAPELQTPVHRREANRQKPPNILVYCGKKDSLRQFDSVKTVLQTCLNSERYTIYHLKHEHVHSTPWQENSVLLVVASEKVYDNVDKSFLNYFTSGGTLLSLVSMFDSQFVDRIQVNKNIGILPLYFKHWENITVICGRHVYKNSDPLLPDINVNVLAKDKNTDKAVIAEANHDLSGGVALLSQVSLEKDPVEMAISPDIFAELKKNNMARFEILRELLTQLGLDCDAGSAPQLTPCYLISAHESLKSSLLEAVKPRLRDNKLVSRDISLLFCSVGDEAMKLASKDLLPVCIDPPSQSFRHFSMDSYLQHLQTHVLGRLVMYTEVAYTTMPYFDGVMFCVPESVGLVAMPTRQTAGRGRGGNAWISPVGCAMFSLHVRVAVSSPLGQRVAFLQHITSLAVVEAVREKPGYENIDLRLKWPNDIYFGKTMKVGGVLVKSSCMVDMYHANIGCGVNITNADPTICVNDVIRQHNISNGTDLQLFTVEEFIGRTITNIERLIDVFQTEGRKRVVERYYTKWLHSNAPVHIQTENLDGQIIGLDDYGYLQVKTPTGTVLSVHDDGNSFDMMRNLIVPKVRS